MKRREKLTLCGILLAGLLLALTACGKEDAGNSPEPLAYYHADHQVMEAYSGVSSACAAEDKLYYLSGLPEDPSIFTVYQIDPADGTCQPLPAFTQLQSSLAPDGKYLPVQIAAAPDGTLRLLADTLTGNTPDGVAAYQMVLLTLDIQGNLLEQVPLEGNSIRYWNERSLFCGGSGESYLPAANDKLLTIRDGEVRATEVKSTVLVPLAENGVAALTVSPDGKQWSLAPIDPVSGQAQKSVSIAPAAERVFSCRFFPGGEGYDFFCSNGLSLWGYRLGEEQPEMVLSWADCDIEGAAVIALRSDSQGRFLCASNSEVFGAEAALLQRQERQEDVRTLTLACRSLPDSVAQAVLRFNRQGSGCRIVVRDYGPAPGAGLAAGTDRMTADLLAGNMPDLFCADGIDFQRFIDQGMAEDLWPYIDGDSQLGRERLVTPLFDAMSQNGRLYTVASGFSIQTALALPELVGDTPGWTVERFFSVYHSMEDCLSVFSPYHNTKEQVLEDVIDYCAEGFLDRQSWTAGFDSPEFSALLEYAGSFPDAAETGRGTQWMQWLPNRQQLMIERRLSDFSRIGDDSFEYLGVWDAVYIGYPGVAGNGSVFSPEGTVGMWSGSENKADAWAFLRTLLLPEHQRYPDPWYGTGASCFPTNQAVFDAMLRKAMEPPERADFMVSSPNGEMQARPVPTQKEIDWFRDFLSGITVVEGCDESIAAIIRDEAARFFVGDQTAEAAASAIQSRVNLYLGERKR